MTYIRFECHACTHLYEVKEREDGKPIDISLKCKCGEYIRLLFPNPELRLDGSAVGVGRDEPQSS